MGIPREMNPSFQAFIQSCGRNELRNQAQAFQIKVFGFGFFWGVWEKRRSGEVSLFRFFMVTLILSILSLHFRNTGITRSDRLEWGGWLVQKEDGA